jgi:hypothetical protein
MQCKQFVGDMDAATETVLRAMEPHITADAATMNRSVGFYCIDGMMEENGDIKMIDFNTRCGPPRYHTNEDADARIAVSAFRQFGLSNPNFDVDACAKEIPDYARVI